LNMKKYLLLIFMIMSSQVYAECNRQDLPVWSYNVQINSAYFDAGSNSVIVTVAYNLASTSYKKSSLCNGTGNFDSYHSRHTVIIGGRESAPQYVVANKSMPATLNFAVNVNGLDRNALANGGYAITPSSYYDNGYTIAQSGGYSNYTPYSGSSSIIANIGAIYSYTTTQDQAAGCPADRPSGYIVQRRSYEVWSDGSARNFGGWYNIADYCSAVGLYTTTQDQAVACPANRPSGHIVQRRSYEVWSDGSTRNFGSWYNIADYCSAVYSYTGYNYTTSACPATQPKGIINLSQSYEVWSDGSVRNYSAWGATSNTCTAVYKSTETRFQTLTCPVAYPNGAGLKQSGTRDIWSDGAKAWSAWTTVEFACSKTVSDVKDNSRKTCAEGQTGYRITEWRRTHIEYISQANLTPAQLAIENEKNATAWSEVEVSNTCVNIPNQVVKTETATRILSCGAVYKGLEGSYTGEVIETGKKVYTYNSSNKQTITTFVSNTPPTYNSTCKASLSDITTEKKNEACGTGESGNKTYYRYVTANSDNTKEIGEWVLLSNNCASNSSSNDSLQQTVMSQSKGLLSNNSVVSSSLKSDTKLKDFIKSLDKSKLGSESYKLNLIIDDLSTGKYNITNVSDTVAEFQKASPNTIVKVSIPKLINQYIGNADISKNNVKDKVINSSELLSDGNILVKYKSLNNNMKSSEVKSFKIKVFNSNVDMNKITY
jgi:hypothetical protein